MRHKSRCTRQQIAAACLANPSICTVGIRRGKEEQAIRDLPAEFWTKYLKVDPRHADPHSPEIRAAVKAWWLDQVRVDLCFQKPNSIFVQGAWSTIA